MTQTMVTNRFLLDLVALMLLTALAAVASGGLIVVLAPWLKRRAVAFPNPRSSHSKPTPQGGGAAVVAAMLAVAWIGARCSGILSSTELPELIAVTAAALLLAITGAIDDVSGLSPASKLLIQCIAVGIVATAMPSYWRLVPALPLWVERAIVFIGIIWFVNLTNFMDGIDWMTVAEIVPITGAIMLLGIPGVVPPLAMVVALAFFGAMLGFAPFNKPVARLFLGDVGSLPIGLVIAWLLLEVARRGHLAAALLLPLYYLADGTLTLLRRMHAGERMWQAHRTHFYQRATAKLTVLSIVGHVFLANLGLVALALLSILSPSPLMSIVSLGAGATIVAFLLARFAHASR
jgi:UDP-N-acetylmuramyl pentapeptide phosphotransferase/UDP-N-acetylglucosamine-1-phosphate transferase